MDDTFDAFDTFDTVDLAAPMPAVNDCWNRIGIQGDKSCDRLPPHVHCRNCPVYASAAKDLLDRLPPRMEATAPSVLNALNAARSTTQRLSLLVFRVGPEWLSLPTRSLDEVAPVRPVHALPHRRDPALLGVANVRGSLTVCVSLSRMLGLEAQPDRPSADGRERAGLPRMLVMATGGRGVVLPVDEVDGIYGIADSAVESLPPTLSGSAVKFSRGVVQCGSRTVGLLDEAALARAIDRSLA
ncbi:chemotaxis protein CheW [soil metagenome]